MLLVMLALSWHCHALWSAAPQLVHRGPSPSRRVPLSSASSRSWVRLRHETDAFDESYIYRTRAHAFSP